MTLALLFASFSWHVRNVQDAHGSRMTYESRFGQGREYECSSLLHLVSSRGFSRTSKGRSKKYSSDCRIRQKGC